MITVDFGQDIGVECLSGYTGRMTVNLLPFGGIDPPVGFVITVDHRREIHQLADTGNIFFMNHIDKFFVGDPGPGGFQRRGRDAGRQHHKQVKWNIIEIVQHIADAIQPQDIGNFMGIDNAGRGAVRKYQPREFRQGQHGAFKMDMAVDKAGRQEKTIGVKHFFGFIIAETNDTAVADGDILRVYFSGKHINQAGIFY